MRCCARNSMMAASWSTATCAAWARSSCSMKPDGPSTTGPSARSRSTPRSRRSDFTQIVHGSSQAIKKVLMDQKKIVGVGNIYANEALFAAGIDPSKPASQLTTHDSRLLLKHTRRILQAAIDSQGHDLP